MSVPSKPFLTNYRIQTKQGYIVLNGDQITRIEAKRVFVLGKEDSWEVTFYLSDGYAHTVPPTTWTRDFVHNIFDSESHE